MKLLIFFPPLLPRYPPMTVPMRAPNIGIGISICPAIAPKMEVPTVALVFINNPPSYFNFLCYVENRFENILQKLALNVPAKIIYPTIGTLLIISSMERERRARFDKSLKKSETPVYFFIRQRHRPTTPFVLV